MHIQIKYDNFVKFGPQAFFAMARTCFLKQGDVILSTRKRAFINYIILPQECYGMLYNILLPV